MPFELGNAFAVIGLDTSPMKQGAGLVGGIVDDINAHLSRIGDTAAGVVLGESIRGLIRDIEEMPRSLFEVEKQFEQFHAGLTGLFEAMAQQVPPTWDQMMQGIAAATEQTRTKVTKAAEDMAAAIAANDRQVADAAVQRSQALDNEQSALQENTSRLAQAQENFQNKLSGYSETFHDTIASVNANFDTGMTNLEARHSDAVNRIELQIGTLASSYSSKVTEITSKAEAQFGDLAEKHQQAMVRVDKDIEDENRKFDDANTKRNASLSDSVTTATKTFAKGLEQVAIDTDQVFKDSASAIEAINKRLSSQLADIRQQELDQQRTFSEKMEDLSLKNQGALTAQQQSDLARQQNRLIADNSAREAALANREKTAQSQAGDSVQKVEQDEQKKLDAITRRMQQEQEKYDDQLLKLQQHYDLDTAIAEKSHQEKLDDLTQKQALELQQYQGNIAKIAAAEAQNLANAKDAYDSKLQELATALSKETGAYDLHAKELQQQRDLETIRAKDQYDKQVRTAELTYQHDVDNFTRARDEIVRRYGQSLVRMDEHDADREAAFADRLRRMGEKQAELDKKIEDDSAQLADKYGRIGKTGAELFTQPWLDKVNELEKKFQIAFTWKPDDASKTAQEQTADRVKQIDDFLLVMDQRTGVALPKLRQGFFELLAGGVDPVKDGVLNIVATLAALPQGRGNIDAISRSFIELSEGGFGRAQRELRQFGIDLSTITTDQGKFILNEQHRLNTAMGVTQQQAFDAIIKQVSVTTDAIAKNLQGTALQLITTLQTMWVQFQQIAGEDLFKSTKDAMSDFITFMRQNQDVVKGIATTIGTTLGNMANTIFNALKRLGQQDAMEAIGDFLTALGRFKDSIASVIGDIIDVFVGGSRSADVFDTLKRFSGLIDYVARDLDASGPDIAASIKTMADGLGGFVHDVLQWFSDHGDETKQLIADTLEATFTGISRLVDYVKAHPDDIQKVQDLFGMTIDNIVKFVDAAAKFSVATTQFVADNSPLLDFLYKLTIFGNSEWVAATGNVFKAIVDGFTSIWDWAYKTDEAIGELKDQLNNFARNFIRDWGNEVAGAFNIAFRVIAASVTLGMSELPGIVKGVLDHIYGHSIIEDWLAGLEVGFAAGMAKVVDAAAEEFGKLPDRMQRVIDSMPQVQQPDYGPYQPYKNYYTDQQSPVDYTGNTVPGSSNPTGTSFYAPLPDDMTAPTGFGMNGSTGVSTGARNEALAYQFRQQLLDAASGKGGGALTGAGGSGLGSAGGLGSNTGNLGSSSSAAGSGGSSGTSYWDTSAGKAFIAQYKAGYDQTLEGRSVAEGRALLNYLDAQQKAAWEQSWAPQSPEQLAAAKAQDAIHAKQVDLQFGNFGMGALSDKPGIPGTFGTPGTYPNSPTLADQRQNQEEFRQQHRERSDDSGELARAIQALAGKLDQKKQGGNGTTVTYNFEKIVVNETAVDWIAEATARLTSRLQNRN